MGVIYRGGPLDGQTADKATSHVFDAPAGAGADAAMHRGTYAATGDLDDDREVFEWRLVEYS